MPDTVDSSTIDPDVLIARGRALAPMLRERAEQTEKDRRVSPEMVQAIRDQDIFRLLQPRRFGGVRGVLKIKFIGCDRHRFSLTPLLSISSVVSFKVFNFFYGWFPAQQLVPVRETSETGHDIPVFFDEL